MSDVGVPTRLTTDGRPQLRSSAFASFCSEWNICHDPSSPYNPQSNGAAEAAVKAMKHLLMKIGEVTPITAVPSEKGCWSGVTRRLQEEQARPSCCLEDLRGPRFPHFLQICSSTPPTAAELPSRSHPSLANLCLLCT